MKKGLILFLFSLPVICFGQQTIQAEIGDIISLTPSDKYRGTIHWQQSSDNLEWNDISGGDMEVFDVNILSLPSYYRARVTEEGCDFDHYSETIEVIEIDNSVLWSNSAS